MNTQAVETIDYEASLVDLWRRHLGYIPEYPVNYEQVQTLVEGMDYVIPNNGLDYMANVGLLIAPGEDRWEAQDCCHLVGALESLRCYRESPDSVHWHKLSKYQRGRVIAQVEGKFDGLAKNMGKFTFRHLALMMMQARNKDELDQAFASLETKLIAEGID